MKLNLSFNKTFAKPSLKPQQISNHWSDTNSPLVLMKLNLSFKLTTAKPSLKSPQLSNHFSKKNSPSVLMKLYFLPNLTLANPSLKSQQLSNKSLGFSPLRRRSCISVILSCQLLLGLNTVSNRLPINSLIISLLIAWSQLNGDG